MGRLEEAKGRLDRALARLEGAAQRPARETGPEPDPDVVAELTASQARCASLEAQSRDVSERLDAAIERLQAILKEDGEHGAG